MIQTGALCGVCHVCVRGRKRARDEGGEEGGPGAEGGEGVCARLVGSHNADSAT